MWTGTWLSRRCVPALLWPRDPTPPRAPPHHPRPTTPTDPGAASPQFKVNGFVVFDNILSTERVDAMHAAFSTLLDNLRERDGDTKLVEDERGVLVPEPAVADLGEHGDIRTGNGRLQQVNRYTCNVPWVQPFADPEVSTR